jgi:hypothetical protein
MATIEIDTDAAREFLEALTERLEAEEFEALASGKAEPNTVAAWRSLDWIAASQTLRHLDELDDGDLSALQQLRLRRDLDELTSRYPLLAVEEVPGG